MTQNSISRLDQKKHFLSGRSKSAATSLWLARSTRVSTYSAQVALQLRAARRSGACCIVTGVTCVCFVLRCCFMVLVGNNHFICISITSPSWTSWGLINADAASKNSRFFLGFPVCHFVSIASSPRSDWRSLTTSRVGHVGIAGPSGDYWW